MRPPARACPRLLVSPPRSRPRVPEWAGGRATAPPSRTCWHQAGPPRSLHATWPSLRRLLASLLPRAWGWGGARVHSGSGPVCGLRVPGGDWEGAAWQPGGGQDAARSSEAGLHGDGERSGGQDSPLSLPPTRLRLSRGLSGRPWVAHSGPGCCGPCPGLRAAPGFGRPGGRGLLCPAAGHWRCRSELPGLGPRTLGQQQVVLGWPWCPREPCKPLPNWTTTWASLAPVK